MCVCLRESARAREREKRRKREKEKEKEKETEKERKRKREKERKSQRERERESERYHLLHLLKHVIAQLKPSMHMLARTCCFYLSSYQSRYSSYAPAIWVVDTCSHGNAGKKSR